MKHTFLLVAAIGAASAAMGCSREAPQPAVQTTTPTTDPETQKLQTMAARFAPARFAAPSAPLAQLFTVHPVDPQPRLIKQAAAIIRDGGVIAYPTDSGYALGCGLGNADAARRIRRIRRC